MQGDEFASECDDSIVFFDQLRSDHRLHRHPKVHGTTLCVTAPPNRKTSPPVSAGFSFLGVSQKSAPPTRKAEYTRVAAPQ